MTTTDFELATIKLWHQWLDANPNADEYELAQAFDTHMRSREGYADATHIVDTLQHERDAQAPRIAAWNKWVQS